MDKLWWFSESNAFFVLPADESAVDESGAVKPSAMPYARHLADLTAFSDTCGQVDQIILVFSQRSFDEAYLAAIPGKLPRLALIRSDTSNQARTQLENLDCDGFTFSPFTVESVISGIKKSYDDKKSIVALQDELKSYTDIAFTAMSSASEMGVVAFYAQAVQNLVSLDSLAEQTLRCLGDLSVQGIIQFTFDDKVNIFPMAVAPGHRRLLDQTRHSALRIVSHGRFLIFNFENAQLLITDAPVADQEKYGRLRDVIAHIASIAEARAKTIKVNEMLSAQQENTRTVMTLLQMASHDNRHAVKTIMTELSQALRELSMGMDLTLEQEKSLVALSDRALGSLEGLHEATDAIEEHFRNLLFQLDKAAELLQPDDVQDDVVIDKSVELF